MNQDLYQEALEEFGRRLGRGREEGLIRQPAAMTLATADARGRPSARTVLLKDFGRDGFVFYTNRESRKGEQLAANSWAALCFYWDPYWEQAVVEGPVQEISPVEADLYWVTRSRISQLGAWASRQSRPLASRARLISEVTAYEAEYRALGTSAGFWEDFQAGTDPAGITTQDPGLSARLDPVLAGRRLANYLQVLTIENQILARANGKSHVLNLEPEDLAALTVEAAAMAKVPLAGTGWVPGAG